jgi:hypothetical protein
MPCSVRLHMLASYLPRYLGSILADLTDRGSNLLLSPLSSSDLCCQIKIVHLPLDRQLPFSLSHFSLLSTLTPHLSPLSTLSAFSPLSAFSAFSPLSAFSAFSPLSPLLLFLELSRYSHFSFPYYFSHFQLILKSFRTSDSESKTISKLAPISRSQR